jgi:hypothetical protein
MIDGLGDALGRFNKAAGESPQAKEKERPGQKKSETTKHGHSYHVHVHANGEHHLTIHKGGQLVHHSIHGSMDEAAEAMKQHAAGSQTPGPEEPGVGNEAPLD